MASDYLSSLDMGGPNSGNEPYSPGTGTPDFGNGSDGSFLQNLFNSIGGLSPQAIGSLLGALGPTAGLLGTLSSNGRTGSTTGQTNQSQNGTTNQTQQGTQSGTTSGQTLTNQNQTTNRLGFGNTQTQQTLDPQAQAAMDRVSAMLGGNAGNAQGAYDQGLSMLRLLADKSFNMNGSAGAGPNTTPSPQAVTGFPQGLPTEYNAGLGNLIKQAFGSFVGDLGSQAITNARGRGFAGGADLLNTAAAPMMGQTLGQVPGMEAQAYLNHVLQAYGLQTQNASAENAARAGALNAATNALGPGVTKYGIDRQADNAQIGNTTSLLRALMEPNQQMMAGNLSLLSAAPRGSNQSTLTGDTSNQSLSGLTQTQGQSQSQNSNQTQGQTTNNTTGNTTQNTSVPVGNQIGQGLMNIGQGAATGYAAADARQQQAAQNQMLLDLLAKRG